MTPNDHVLDFMLSQLRQHVRTNYLPLGADATADAQADTSGQLEEANQLIASLTADQQSLQHQVANYQTQVGMLSADLKKVREQMALVQMRPEPKSAPGNAKEIGTLRAQLAACHENQVAYRAEIATLKQLCEQRQGHVQEANAALLVAQEELNTLRTKRFGAAMGVRDVNKLIEQLNAAHEELRRRDAQQEGEVVNVGQWDGSVEIGSHWHKDAS